MPAPSLALTVAAGGDVDALAGRLAPTPLGDPVEGLDGEGVGGVWQQAPDHHPAGREATLRRPVADAVPAGGAGPAGGTPAAQALHRIAQVLPAAPLQGLAPLQRHRGVVDLRHHAARRRGGLC